MDTLTPSQRSERMARIRGRNTKPELVVRQLLHAMGYRYRLHDKRLPGHPDITFFKRKKVIFVHGCFWHRHEGCSLARLPKSRLDFWLPKLEGNKLRDKAKTDALEASGWEALVVWECQLRHREDLVSRLREFLDGSKGNDDESG